MVRVLLPALRTSEKPVDILISLGLLGDLSAVRPLVDLLSNEKLAGAAAEALDVITGASPFEDVVVPEEMSEDELFPSELEALRATSELPRRVDRQPLSTRVRRLSRDPAVWNEWLRSNSSRFPEGRRYRSGAPCTPQVLLDCLRSETFPKSYRRWVGEELLIRYGFDLPFEPDMPVVQQRRVLEGAAAKIAEMTATFAPGHWYFAAQRVTS
jgi:hypothetical protein